MATKLKPALLISGIVLADQLTKLLVRHSVTTDQDLIAGVKLVNVENRGVAFGAFAGHSVLLLALFSLLICGLLIYIIRGLESRFTWVAVSCLLGGAAGNLIDRIFAGQVTDFIKLPHWPAFNIADIAVVGGVLVLVLILGKQGINE